MIADSAFHEAVIAAANNRFFQPFGAMIRTALFVTAPTTNAIFDYSAGALPRRTWNIPFNISRIDHTGAAA